MHCHIVANIGKAGCALFFSLYICINCNYVCIRCQITSIVYLYFDIGERIAEKHDGSTMIIEGSPNITKIVCTMWPIYMKNQLFIFAIVVIVVDISTM